MEGENELFFNAFCCNPAGMIIADLETTRFQYINKSGLAMLGFTPEEVIGKTSLELNLIEPQSREKILSLLKQQGFVKDANALIRKKNGETFWSLFSVHLVECGHKKYAITSFYDITDLEKEELKEKNKELADSNKELEEFAYIVSHDLQEPLRQVAGFAELLAKRYKEKIDEKAGQYIAYILDGSEQMKRLISDLLSYSRVGRREIVCSPVDCTGILKAVLSRLGKAIDQSQATIQYDPLPMIPADATLLAELFQNLICNAIKFRGGAPPSVHIGAIEGEKAPIFFVRDNGIGIDSKYAERIFMVFERLHTRKEYEGTGIGLAICKKVVERHGGRIWVESVLGEGATFYFSFPLR